MPVDFNAPDDEPKDGDPKAENEESMFAPTPLWDRDPKRRRDRRAAASRAVRDPAMDAGEAGAGAIGGAAEPADVVYETQPAIAPEGMQMRRRGSAGAVAAGVVAIAAIAAIGWYATRPRDSGLAELTPGAATTGPATAPTAAAPAASQLAVNLPHAAATAPPATTAPVRDRTTTAPVRDRTTTTTTRATAPVAPHRTHTTLAARAPAPRVRPAQPSSAMEAGVNAGATAPMISTPAPTPAPATAPAMDAGPVNPVTPPSPTTTTPSGATAQPVNPASEPTTTP